MPAIRDWFTCPRCSNGQLVWSEAKGHPICSACQFAPAGSRAVYDLEAGCDEQTDAHYTLQWGRDKAFLEFLDEQPKAKSIMPGGQMGWPALFEEIRNKAKSGGSVSVYDAACGFGGITRELVTDETAQGTTPRPRPRAPASAPPARSISTRSPCPPT